MKIYDISQEVFHCQVFPGDPVPVKEEVLKIENGEICNLTAFRMCAHNGTHVDAPYHFCTDGRKIDEIPMESFIGKSYVAEWNGEVDDAAAKEILDRARKADKQAAKRILIKGKAVVLLEAAKVFASAGLLLLGNESQTVGPEEAPMEVHMQLLGAGVILLEGICLSDIEEGDYLLNAAPLNLGGADGAPCRAVLIQMDE